MTINVTISEETNKSPGKQNWPNLNHQEEIENLNSPEIIKNNQNSHQNYYYSEAQMIHQIVLPNNQSKK